jgi:hypothetical protein
MTEKLQLVDAGLGERERTRGLPRSRAPLEKSKRLAFVTVQTLSPRGVQGNKITVMMMMIMTVILFSYSSTFEALAYLNSYTKSSGRKFILEHVY